MAGDYTRTTFRPRDDHTSVLMQQGRVMLDADWNEQVELLDRRLRAEVVDTLSRCVTSQQTPDAFLIALAAGHLTIAPGRAYIDGLLAENHGAEPFVYDPVLGELTGTQPLDYGDQPYFPNSATVAPLPTTGTYVAYLDVWERELTYLEDPDLIEKAVAVDTAARLQTAWQVRLLEAPDGTTCDTDVPGWDALTAPSAGRLSTAAVGVPASTDPCTIPPSGGYRGTENRLYRIEIHDRGPLGTATFKWSRDNASIASHVRTIDSSATEVTLDRLGRDGVKRITVGDWIEVTDDWLELNGLSGELRKVAAVDEVTQSLTLATALTAGAFDATDPTRHTRVIGWDQKGADVDAAGGVVTVPAGGPASPIVLEDGVQISFDTDAGGDFHVADWWVFAARTADASVEMLVEEPPRGIEHHYCRLGVVAFPDTVTDCRQRPPDDADTGCDCTVCVTPESHATGTLTIQKAIDMVKVPGGKVCLQPGVYRLRETVQIVGAGSVEIQGKGWKTIVLGPARAPAFLVERSAGVIIDMLTVLTTASAKPAAVPTGIAILLRNTIGTVIERCVLLQLPQFQRDPTPPPGDGTPGTPQDPCPPETLRAASTAGSISDLRAVFGPRGAAGPLIALDGIVIETLIDQNVLLGTTGIGPVWGQAGKPLQAMKGVSAEWAAATADRASYLLTFDLAIEENLLICWLTGVSLEGFTLDLGTTRIADNSVLVGLRAAIVAAGLGGPGARTDVRGNVARVIGCGIAVGTDDTRVVDNDVRLLRGLGTTSREGSLVSLPAALSNSEGVAARYLRLFGGDAILLTPSLRPVAIARCQVRGNRAVDVVGNGIAIRTQVASASIADNMVQEVGGGGVVMADDVAAEILQVEQNEVLQVALLQDQRSAIAAGILLANVTELSVTGNVVEEVGVSGQGALARFGIVTSRCRSIRVSANKVADVGPPDEFLGLGAGIAVVDSFQRVDVLDNAVRRSEKLESAPTSGEWFGILIAGGGEAKLEERGAVTGFGDRGSFTVLGNTAGYTFLGDEGRVIRFARARETLGVRGNVVEAYGQVPAVLIITDAACIFGENRCLATVREGVPAARIGAGAVVAANNYVQGPLKGTALELELPAGGPYTVLGNIASGPIEVDGAALPAPWQPLNIT